MTNQMFNELQRKCDIISESLLSIDEKDNAVMAVVTAVNKYSEINGDIKARIIAVLEGKNEM